MQKPLIIGITGGIGGGKTTFSEFLQECGELVFNTDREGRRLQNEDEQVISEIKTLFGNDIYTPQGLNRSGIAKIVFNNKEKLNELNQIIHPRVKSEFLDWTRKHYNKKRLFMECAVLFEGDFNKLVDRVVVVTAPESVRIQRVMQRDNLDEQRVRERIKNQLSEEVKIKKADWTVNTDNSEKSIQYVQDFLKKLEKQ
ncbi:MAG: dephospho-CoA kinase [Paludibacteraceae bacterium]